MRPPPNEAITTDSLIAQIKRSEGARCRRCRTPIGKHEALLSMVMGFGEAPFCLRCLADLLGQPPREFAVRLLGHIHHRECQWGAWQWASQQESTDPESIPPFLLEEQKRDKSATIDPLIQTFKNVSADPQYLAFFAWFNQGQYYEAHDVLEVLWLRTKNYPEGDFYKALIQLAGAFVHLQKGRLQPAGALLRLSRRYLESYPPVFGRISLTELFALIDRYLGQLEANDFKRNPLQSEAPPRLTPPIRHGEEKGVHSP